MVEFAKFYMWWKISLETLLLTLLKLNLSIEPNCSVHLLSPIRRIELCNSACCNCWFLAQSLTTPERYLALVGGWLTATLQPKYPMLFLPPPRSNATFLFGSRIQPLWNRHKYLLVLFFRRNVLKQSDIKLLCCRLFDIAKRTTSFPVPCWWIIDIFVFLECSRNNSLNTYT